MKRFLITAFLLAGFTAARAQDISSTNLPDINEIVLTGKMNVVLKESDKNGFEIRLVNTDPKKVVWTCNEGKLDIKLKANTQKQGSADVVVYYKRITSAKISGASARFESPITVGIFHLNVSNGATVSGEFATKDLAVQAEGNSATTLSGETDYLTLKANSKAKVDARALEARSAIVSSQFGAEVFVWGTEKLDATAGSNSVIYYKGTPEIFKMAEKTLGTVEQFSK